ncbi:hypothetical protein NFI96_010052 [Prochilodus magdalenae]|nr:hypothetical protein NFI96_010052 [Prochilodus magdalenae]
MAQIGITAVLGTNDGALTSIGQSWFADGNWFSAVEKREIENSGDDSGLQERPDSPSSTHHPGQDCDGCGVSQVPEYNNHQGPEAGLQHQLHHQESPIEDVLPASSEEVQPVPGADGTVLHCHHRITMSITVWGSSATKHDIHRQQCIIRSAEKTTGVKLPILLDLHTSRTILLALSSNQK